MSARALWSARLARANVLLTASTFVVVIGSIALDVRGGTQNPWTDRVQAYVLWGYFFGTPVLGMIAWLTSDRASEMGLRAHWPIALWLLTAVGATFVVDGT